MTSRDLKNIHTTRNSCRDALPCVNIALKLPRYFCLLMGKPLECYLQVWSPYYQAAQCKMWLISAIVWKSVVFAWFCWILGLEPQIFHQSFFFNTWKSFEQVFYYINSVNKPKIHNFVKNCGLSRCFLKLYMIQESTKIL